MREIEIQNLFDMTKTIAAGLFEGKTYPFEVLPEISGFIEELGRTLPEDRYERRGDNVWIAKSAIVAPTAYINGPVIIDPPLRVYPGQCHCGKACGSGKFHGIKECDPF